MVRGGVKEYFPCIVNKAPTPLEPNWNIKHLYAPQILRWLVWRALRVHGPRWAGQRRDAAPPHPAKAAPAAEL